MLHPVIASREVTRYILDTFGLHTKKRFGQNFLINESVVRGIAEKAKIGPGDLVLKSGPNRHIDPGPCGNRSRYQEC